MSTHAPQFRSNRSVAPKLMLIIISNVHIYPHLPTRRCIESTFCPREKVINICVSSLAGTSTVAFLSPSLLKNTSAPPPPSQPKHPPRVLKIQVQELLLQQWRPSPRSQRYVFPPFAFSPPIPFPIPSVTFLISAIIFRILGITQLFH